MAASASTLTLVLRAFRSRNYRLFFTGQLISLIGTWLTTTATLWMVQRLTNDPRVLGLVGFAGQIPSFFLAPLGGVLVDRWNRHRTIVATQILSMLQSAALAVLAFANVGGYVSSRSTVILLLGLLAIQGLINAFDMPARQAFVIQLVEDPADLPNAIALNSSMFNTARLLGPAVGGALIYLFGEGLCFTIDAASYLAVIVGLLMMRLRPQPPRGPAKHVIAEFHEGLRYAMSFPPIRSILLLLALVSLVGAPYSVLMPYFAQNILHGNSLTYGLLTAASGLGALAGALRLAARKSVLGLGRIIPTAAAGFGLAIIGFAYAEHLWLALPLLVISGYCMVTQMASGNTLLQTIVDNDKRGRVMSLFGMAFQGMMPVGSLVGGTLAAGQLGPRGTLALGGALCVLGAAAFALYLPTLRTHVRPIYIQRGILSEVASGLQTADATMESRES